MARNDRTTYLKVQSRNGDSPGGVRNALCTGWKGRYHGMDGMGHFTYNCGIIDVNTQLGKRYLDLALKICELSLMHARCSRQGVGWQSIYILCYVIYFVCCVSCHRVLTTVPRSTSQGN